MRSRPVLLLAALTGALLLPVTPAAASGGITSPGAGEVVAAESVVPLRAVVDGPAATPSELSLVEPGTGRESVVAVSASPEGGELAADFDTACAQQQCTDRVPARNGQWTLRLRGAADDERTFELRIPPAVPSDVVVEPSGQEVLLQWTLGAEPDLTGYAVEDGAGAPVADVPLAACDAAGRCRLELPADAGSWAVRAFRSACPGCAETLPSEPSETVTPSSAAPPVPELVQSSPSPAAGQQVPDQRSAFVRSYGTGVRLPAPAPAAAPPGGQTAAPPDGPYDVALDYAPPPRGAAAEGASLEETLSGLGGGNRLPLLVLSGVLVGASVLLRRWLRHAVID